MITTDGRDLGAKMLEAVKGYVTRAFHELGSRLDGLEKRLTEIPAGPKGDDGEPGKDGAGIVGPAGPVGEKGEHGEKGEAGTIGPRGEPGETGSIGPAGAIGAIGAIGADGERGEKGESVVGPHGERGERGLFGEKGTDGRDGRDGKDAREPIDGIDGVDGRDALQIEILDGVDVAKRYPRGTYAKHNGGIVRALRATDPIGIDAVTSEGNGWQTVVDGVKEITVLPGADERSFAVQTCLTSGKMVEKTVTLPQMIYRGIWMERSGGEGINSILDPPYQRGDTVTWDGSLWHCEKTTRTKPGTSPDFKLIAKRGRDGKDGIGTKGDPGPPGKPGR